MLANLNLHYVLDLWAERWIKRRARGDVIIVRYCDDFILGFQHRDEAERFRKELRERLAQFRLELHPEKTRLIAFGRYALERRHERGLARAPETFQFLGLTHICGRSRSGQCLLHRHTQRKRMVAKLREVSTELQRRRHQTITEQGAWLGAVVRGHCAYYGVPTNSHAIAVFHTQVVRRWMRSLRRRSQRHCLNWQRMGRLAARWLPPVHLVHPWPEERFGVGTQGRSPVR